jgi:uncharacterized protein YdaU (DUF1376 family)
MSLPWFPFHIDAYTGDTMHLTTEEHGCYLLMMLAYYRTEKPLPAADRSLAALVKLPIERWMEAKPALAPFFREEAGLWYHDRIELEIKERCSKHAQSIARAKHAAEVKHGRASSKDAPSTPQASPKPARSRKLPEPSVTDPVKDAPSVPDASPEQSPEHPHLQLHPSLNRGGREDAPPKSDSQVLGSEIDPAFWPSGENVERAWSQGFSDANIEAEVRKFVGHHQDKGGLSKDWQGSFAKWLEREIAHRAKQQPAKAPARVEVNNAPDWDSYCKMWLTLQRWPSHGAGGEPGMVSCTCPPEILTKHGIDPKTGFKQRAAS